MASLIDPRCGVPSWQQTDEGVVRSCARKTGWILAVILGLFLVVPMIFFIIFKKSEEAEYDPIENKTTVVKRSKLPLIIGTVIVAAVIVLLCVFLVPYLSVISWKGKQEQIKLCMSQGQSRKECMQSIQRWEEQRMRAQAQLGEGSEIAEAIRSRK